MNGKIKFRGVQLKSQFTSTFSLFILFTRQHGMGKRKPRQGKCIFFFYQDIESCTSFRFKLHHKPWCSIAKNLRHPPWQLINSSRQKKSHLKECEDAVFWKNTNLNQVRRPSEDSTRFSLNSPKIFGHPSQFPCSRASQQPPLQRKDPFSPSLWNHLGFHPSSCNFLDCIE